MKTKYNIGNVTLVLRKDFDSGMKKLLLGLKRSKKKADNKRKRKKVGNNHWVPPGGATKVSDKSQKHSAQRELFEETGLIFPLKAFKKVGILQGYFEGELRWFVHLYKVMMGDVSITLRPNEEYVDMRWFQVNKLPFEKMLQGDKSWIPRIIRGDKVIVRIFAKAEAHELTSVSVKKYSQSTDRSK